MWVSGHSYQRQYTIKVENICDWVKKMKKSEWVCSADEPEIEVPPGDKVKNTRRYVLYGTQLISMSLCSHKFLLSFIPGIVTSVWSLNPYLIYMKDNGVLINVSPEAATRLQYTTCLGFSCSSAHQPKGTCKLQGNRPISSTDLAT